MRLCLLSLISIALIGCDKQPDSRLATPKGTATIFFEAMYDNDVATAKSYIVSGPRQAEFLEILTHFVAAMRGADDALHKRFADEIKKLAGRFPDQDQIAIAPKQIEEGEEKIDGESATITLKGTNMTIALARVEGAWKVDLTKSWKLEKQLSDPKQFRVVIGTFAGMARGADQTKAEIEAGKYASAPAAMDALLANLKNAAREEKERAIREPAPR